MQDIGKGLHYVGEMWEYCPHISDYTFIEMFHIDFKDGNQV